MERLEQTAKELAEYRMDVDETTIMLAGLANFDSEFLYDFNLTDEEEKEVRTLANKYLNNNN